MSRYHFSDFGEAPSLVLPPPLLFSFESDFGPVSLNDVESVVFSHLIVDLRDSHEFYPLLHNDHFILGLSE